MAGPLGEGKTVFATCASCHGSTGEGGVGRQLSNGEVLKTFPKFEDQASLVYTGSAAYSGKIYGDPNRPGGPAPGRLVQRQLHAPAGREVRRRP